MVRSFLSSFVTACMVTALLFFGVKEVVAQVRQSTNYRIQSESINSGGGFSSSPNYKQQSTVGEVGTGNSNSTTYYLKAGYQQMNEVYIALTGGSIITLTPSLGGIVGGTSNGSTTVTVVTDNSAGYSLTIAASNNPAMQKGADSIANYVPAGAPPDFAFSIPAGSAVFGFSPEGVDVASRYKDNGSTCNTGSGNVVLACWDGISTSATTIASKSSANHPLGSTTTVRFRVGLAPNSSKANGLYTATTTITALPL